MRLRLRSFCGANCFMLITIASVISCGFCTDMTGRNICPSVNISMSCLLIQVFVLKQDAFVAISLTTQHDDLLAHSLPLRRSKLKYFCNLYHGSTLHDFCRRTYYSVLLQNIHVLTSRKCCHQYHVMVTWPPNTISDHSHSKHNETSSFHKTFTVVRNNFTTLF